MCTRILLQAAVVLVVSGLKPCMWKLEDCHKEGPTHPDYRTNCYEEYSSRPRLCRRKCVGPRPYSPKCTGYCEEFVTKCLSEGKTSTVTVPADASLTNLTGTLVTSNKTFSNASGNESQTTGSNPSFTIGRESSEAAQNLPTASVSPNRTWGGVIAAAILATLGFMTVVTIGCMATEIGFHRSAKANENGQTFGPYEAVPLKGVTDPPHASNVKETTA